MPRADDMPFFDVDSHEVPTQVNPLGAKGVGEAGHRGRAARADERGQRRAGAARRAPPRHAGDAGARLARDPGGARSGNQKRHGLSGALPSAGSAFATSVKRDPCGDAQQEDEMMRWRTISIWVPLTMALHRRPRRGPWRSASRRPTSSCRAPREATSPSRTFGARSGSSSSSTAPISLRPERRTCRPGRPTTSASKTWDPDPRRPAPTSRSRSRPSPNP